VVFTIVFRVDVRYAFFRSRSKTNVRDESVGIRNGHALNFKRRRRHFAPGEPLLIKSRGTYHTAVGLSLSIPAAERKPSGLIGRATPVRPRSTTKTNGFTVASRDEQLRGRVDDISYRPSNPFDRSRAPNTSLEVPSPLR